MRWRRWLSGADRAHRRRTRSTTAVFESDGRRRTSLEAADVPPRPSPPHARCRAPRQRGRRWRRARPGEGPLLRANRLRLDGRDDRRFGDGLVAARCRRCHRHRAQTRLPPVRARPAVGRRRLLRGGRQRAGDRHPVRRSPAPATSGRFRVAIIWRSVRARRRTRRRVRLYTRSSTDGSTPIHRRQATPPPLRWPIPSLSAPDLAAETAGRRSLAAARRCRRPRRSDHARGHLLRRAIGIARGGALQRPIRRRLIPRPSATGSIPSSPVRRSCATSFFQPRFTPFSLTRSLEPGDRRRNGRPDWRPSAVRRPETSIARYGGTGSDDEALLVGR